jgi:hypothetical protein
MRIKTIRAGVLWAISAMALMAAPSAFAQQSSDLPSAPIPSQIDTARKVFISNGGSDSIYGVLPANLAYDEFYAAMKSWGKYELTTAPSDADLVFQIRFISIPGGGPIRLEIVDPKSHVTLWPIAELVQPWARLTTGRKNFDKAMAALVNDLKELTSQPAGAADPGTAK